MKAVYLKEGEPYSRSGYDKAVTPERQEEMRCPCLPSEKKESMCRIKESGGFVDMRLGALEAGGTKMVLAVGNEQGEISEQAQIPTRTPAETVPELIAWFRERKIEALGIACFGPVDVNPQSKTYGYILETPKLPWVRYDLVGELKRALNVPMRIDTDVNGSCLGEMTFGCAKGIDSVLYLTVGTGIGAGISIGGRLVHGMLHPEAGHILLSRHPEDPGECVCPYHDNCIEGLASGTSIEARWGKNAKELADNELVWEIESYYLAQGLVDYIMTVSPKKIILGGGVMHQEHLFPLIRKKVKEMIGGYLKTEELEHMDTYIVPNSLNDDQGILGALQLAWLSVTEPDEAVGR